MGRKSRKKKQIKQQKYIKKKQEQNISFEKKLALRIEKIARYISMIIYVIVCMFLLGGFYQLEITPEFLEETLGVIALMVAVGMFLCCLIQYGQAVKVKKIRKESRKGNALLIPPIHQVDL